jgi:hypothetical protein
MKKILSLIFLLILIPNLVWAAAFTSKAPGNWTTEGATTWNEAGHPGNGDTVAIANGHTITVDVDHDIGTTSCLGGLTIAAGITATASGALTMGATADSTLTGDGAATLIMGTNNLVLGRVNIVHTNADSTHWFQIISTSGQITASGTPKQQWGTSGTPLTYFRLGIGGNMDLSLNGTTGSLTNGMYLNHFVIDDNGQASNPTLLLGAAATTPLATTLSLYNGDIRETGAITTKGVIGAAVGIRTFNHVTFNHSTVYRTIALQGTNGWIFDNCVFGNYNFLGSHTSGGHTVKNSLQYATLGATATGYFGSYDNYNAWTIKDNYYYNNQGNSRFFSTDTAANGTGTKLIAGNILEIIQNSGDWIAMITRLNMNVLRNIIIDNASDGFAFAIAANANTPTVNHARNTIVGKTAATYTGLLYFKTAATSVVINAVNNIISGDGVTLTNGNWLATITQNIAYAGYNAYNNVTNRWGSLTGGTWTYTSGPTGEMTANPQLIDSSRNLATWNSRINGGTATAAAALTYLLAINGYNSGTKIQSDTPSVYLPSKLIEWVKYGFSPTNGVLRNAGDAAYAVTDDGVYTLGSGSSTIGAMEWQNPRRKRAM